VGVWPGLRFSVVVRGCAVGVCVCVCVLIEVVRTNCFVYYLFRQTALFTFVLRSSMFLIRRRVQLSY
jgi:hypothetical protein